MGNLPESTEAECPVCLAPMEPEDRDGVVWLVCANGCPTEMEAPPPPPLLIVKSAVA